MEAALKESSNEEVKAIAEQEKEEPETKERKKQSEEIADAAMGRCRLFHTPDHQSFAVIQKDGHQETWAIRSRDFDLWLRVQAYRAMGKIPSAQMIRDARNFIEGEAFINSPVQTVHIRFAQHEEDIYMDLANPSWEQVKVTKDGFEVVPADKSPVRFFRTEAMLELPYPMPFEESLPALRDFLNLEHEGDLVLILSWLLGAMRPTGPYPILILQGEQGSGKSTTAKLLRSLLDPSSPKLRSLPKSERDLAISATRAWILNFDNLSHLEGWLSDAFCRVATGGGLSTRTLFTNDSETIFRIKRPLILNGISDIATRHDLADRCLIINHPPIPEERRRTEREIDEEWSKVRPRILGALLIAASTALRNIGQVKLDRLPRMADFAEWVTAAEAYLPWEKGEFLKQYALNREYLVDVGLESDEVGAAVLQLMQRRNNWTGTPTELLKRLNGIVSKSVQRRKYWPKRPNTLSGRLVRVAPVLRKKGIKVERSKSGTRNIMITKTAKRTVPIDHVVQQPKSRGESSGQMKKARALAEPYVSPARHTPLLQIVGGQGDAVDRNAGSPETNDQDQTKAVEADWETGEL
jgi:putative DNA primase/helicase